ncbi:rh229 [macacine betaherpesvirus 3]|uniref:Rh229 n=1 Tax=Rhesus cytomegalovirus (strain 68-1) TaxID=47929 RepID=Q2FA68_RHCM6|nr:rh229 [macacine betaherpesvirus 3]
MRKLLLCQQKPVRNPFRRVTKRLCRAHCALICVIGNFPAVPRKTKILAKTTRLLFCRTAPGRSATTIPIGIPKAYADLIRSCNAASATIALAPIVRSDDLYPFSPVTVTLPSFPSIPAMVFSSSRARDYNYKPTHLSTLHSNLFPLAVVLA